jgi:hypothetical protein
MNKPLADAIRWAEQVDLHWNGSAAAHVRTLLAAARSQAEDRKDAERYRWLRDHPTFHAGVTILIAAEPGEISGDVTGKSAIIDAYVDHAIAASPINALQQNTGD